MGVDIGPFQRVVEVGWSTDRWKKLADPDAAFSFANLTGCLGFDVSRQRAVCANGAGNAFRVWYWESGSGWVQDTLSAPAPLTGYHPDTSIYIGSDTVRATDKNNNVTRDYVIGSGTYTLLSGGPGAVLGTLSVAHDPTSGKTYALTVPVAGNYGVYDITTNPWTLQYAAAANNAGKIWWDDRRGVLMAAHQFLFGAPQKVYERTGGAWVDVSSVWVSGSAPSHKGPAAFIDTGGKTLGFMTDLGGVKTHTVEKLDAGVLAEIDDTDPWGFGNKTVPEPGARGGGWDSSGNRWVAYFDSFSGFLSGLYQFKPSAGDY